MLICAKHSAKYLTYVVLFKLLNNPVLFCETINLSLLNGKLRLRKAKSLSKITQLVSGVAGTQTAYSLLSGPFITTILYSIIKVH